jgi:hypothetical protein
MAKTRDEMITASTQIDDVLSGFTPDEKDNVMGLWGKYPNQEEWRAAQAQKIEAARKRSGFGRQQTATAEPEKQKT